MNYASSITVEASQKDSFLSVSKEVEKWWGKVDASISAIDDEFSISFGATEWRFKVMAYSEFDAIVWKCVKAHHEHDGLENIKEEWLGTELYWRFIQKGEMTEIVFLHKGLAPNLNCYEVCETGWNFYIGQSLKQFLETGKGSPYI